MRKFGAFLMAVGFSIAIIYPILWISFSGRSLDVENVYVINRDKPWSRPEFEISVSDNPARLTFYSHVEPDSKYMQDGIDLAVKITGPKGVVLDEIVKLKAIEGEYVAVYNYAPHGGSSLFVVPEGGTHTFDINMVDQVDRSMSNIYFSLDGRVGVPDTTYLRPGAIAMLIGFFLFLRQRKNKPKSGPDDSEEAENDNASPSAADKINWGRDKNES